MFERLTSPEDVFDFKLGALLTGEHDSLEMLEEFERMTSRPELRDLFHRHAEETRHQIANLERAFGLLDHRVDDSPSPTTKGLLKEGRSTLRKTDSSLVDSVLLSGGLEAEHYEIAVYETLVVSAEARGATEVAALLRENLDQEKEAARAIAEAAKRIAAEGGAAGSAEYGGADAARVDDPVDDRRDIAAEEAGATRATPAADEAASTSAGATATAPMTTDADPRGASRADLGDVGHPFDQTNGIVEGIDGDSDGTAASDRGSAADRDAADEAVPSLRPGVTRD